MFIGMFIGVMEQFVFFYWSTFDLQCCVSCTRTGKWFMT